ncbi:hypothetical protein DUNSADRAFT_11041 [Dunaliella salina]|uniref:Uncharacterized protein n=1 Tax=Dunaliella salina TaxID=3046 RepID=A0ABQ7GE51_DUNSA|nr:hypothetical protein DUNSADRAFT_11041 [Dunaliella salina]|eukprot:KAF5832891.1 hypothetical protein DUNSADRAFT_11041 [Dunaliella salina]
MSDLPSVTVKKASSPSAASTAELLSGSARASLEAGHQQFHITLGGMHLPHADVHTFHTPTNLFSPGSVACATTGTLQMPSRQTIGGLAVPSGMRGMELWGIKSGSDGGVRWESRGSGSSSSSPAISNSNLKDVGPMAFLNETILSVGCCGLMLLPRKATYAADRSSTQAASSSSSSSTTTTTATTTTSSSSRHKTAPQACLPPASCALLSQSLLGHERFFSLMISDMALRYLQPPHTPPRTWQHLRRPHKGPSLAAANAAMQHRKRQQQQQQQQQQQLGAAPWACWEEGLPCPPVAVLPDNVRVSDRWVVSWDSGTGSGSKSGSGSDSDPSRIDFTNSSSSNRSSSSSSSSSSKGSKEGASGSSLTPSSKAPQRRLPAASSPWSLSSQVQLRIFEKRYQWLIRQAVHQHGCFGIASARGMGTVVFVNRYILNNSDFYIVVEGSSRLLFNPARAATVPASFGLAAVEDVLVVQDQAQLTDAETDLISRTAGQILTLLATGAQAYLGSICDEYTSNAGFSFVGGLMQQQRALQSGSASESDSDSSDSDSDEEDEGADGSLREGHHELGMLVQAYAQQLEGHTLDAASASQFSLMLSALMPIEVEKRRKFMLTFSSKARLSEQKQHLANFPNVAAAAAVTLMSCPPEHPMRRLLGLQHLPQLNQD